MSIKNYRFVSPGVFVNEIDNSQLPASPAGIGPVIIGRAEKGPALRPTTVNSFEEFVNIFGTPNPGNSGDDVWRQGTNTTATTYGMYAAQAYLRNSSPLTYIRLLGAESDNPSNANQAGDDEAGLTLGGKAYGLLLFTRNSSSNAAGVDASLGGAAPAQRQLPRAAPRGVAAAAARLDGRRATRACHPPPSTSFPPDRAAVSRAGMSADTDGHGHVGPAQLAWVRLGVAGRRGAAARIDVIASALAVGRIKLAEEPDAEDGADRDMGGADRQSERRDRDHR